ncbi:4Fe-4S ferredoxin, partial [Singulisphaera rosea]
MAKLDEHPTVIRHRQRLASETPAPRSLDAAWLRRLCLEAGADDVGFVALDRAELDDQRAEIVGAFP